MDTKPETKTRTKFHVSMELEGTHNYKCYRNEGTPTNIFQCTKLCELLLFKCRNEEKREKEKDRNGGKRERGGETVHRFVERIGAYRR